MRRSRQLLVCSRGPQTYSPPSAHICRIVSSTNPFRRSSLEGQGRQATALALSAGAASAQTVYVAPGYAAPVYVAPAPVYVAPAPVYTAPGFVGYGGYYYDYYAAPGAGVTVAAPIYDYAPGYAAAATVVGPAWRW